MGKGISAWRISAVYIGTVIGAGFATGQEIYTFFNAFGISGLWGIVFAAVLFMLFGYIIIEMGLRLGAKSHLELLRHSLGDFWGRILDMLIMFFLFGGLTAMIAGTGAIFTQQFGMPAFIGGLLMAALTAITVLTGLKGVINSISYVVPFLLIAVFGIAIYSILNAPLDFASVPSISSGGLLGNWVWAFILYVSYNLILSVSVLAPLGAEISGRKTVLKGAILGGLGLGIGSFLIYLALAANFDVIRGLEVPMAFIAGQISGWAQAVFTVVLIAEIYTTAVGSLYGFTARITHTEKTPWIVVAVISTLAFFASMFGFSSLVKYLYPLVGYAGIILLIALLQARYLHWRRGV